MLIPTLEIGGAEIDLVRNLPMLDRNRFAPVVCALLGQVTLSAELSSAGVTVTSLSSEVLPGRGFYHWSLAVIERSCRYLVSVLPASVFTRLLASGEKYIGVARSVACYMDEAEIDVVHSICRCQRTPPWPIRCETATHCHACVSQNWYQRDVRLFGMIERYWLHHRVQIAIANSQAVLNELRAAGIPDQKLILLHNGIDAAKFADTMPDAQKARDRLAVPPDALVFSCVGNLYERKGHADLLQALHLLKDRLPPNWLLFAAGRDVDGNLA